MTLPEIHRDRPQIGAFFDMDKTIIAENSASLFVQYRYQQGEIGNMDLLKGLGAYLQYKLGILDIRSWTVGMMKQFSGQSEAELERVSYTLGIYKAIHTIFTNDANVQHWLRAANKGFNGDSALQRMTSGVKGIADVRSYLDAWAYGGGW